MFNNKVTQAVNTVLNNNNNNVSKETQDMAKKEALVGLLVLVLFLLLNFVFGPWLWNNIVKKLIPSVGTARWYDTVLLSVLLGLVLPM